jgi:hypothetical protein
MDLKSGGRLITEAATLEQMREGLEPGQRLWLFSDWRIVAPDNWYLSDAEPELKALVMGWMGGHDAWAVADDGVTTVHRFLSRAEMQTQVETEAGGLLGEAGTALLGGRDLP